MIKLSDDLMFAKGGRRDCFIDPEDPSKCIKTLNERGDPVERRKKSSWYKRLRPLYFFDDNARELDSFRQLERKDDVVWAHFPRCYGLVETSFGKGIATDLIRDGDGAVSHSFRDHVASCGKTQELFSALDDFFQILLRENVATRDILDHNLVVRVGADGLRVYMIDGFGSSEFIPISSWIPMLGRRKVLRKIRRFKNRYGMISKSGQ